MAFSSIPVATCTPFFRLLLEELNDNVVGASGSPMKSPINTFAPNIGVDGADAADEPESLVDDLLSASETFHASNEYPVHLNRVKHVVGRGVASKEEVARDLAASYPILHEDVIHLICAFLESKLVHGSEKEKQLYKVGTIYNAFRWTRV